MTPSSFPLPLILCSLVHSYPGRTLNVVAGNVATELSSVPMIWCVGAMRRVKEWPRSLVVAGGIADIVDDDSSACVDGTRLLKT